MHKIKTSALTLLLALGLAFSTMSTMIPKIHAANPATDQTFSIMQISDTQHLAFLNPTLYNDITSWIVNNSASYNLKMVVHTGDFIDTMVFKPPATIVVYNASELAQEWTVANASMGKLLDAGIPYCWCAGNMDQTPWANPDGTMAGAGSSYLAFNTTYMRSKSYWVSDIYDPKNTAVKFTCNNYPFMVINLEYVANSSAIAWMKGLLDNSTGVNVIIAPHCYLNGEAGYGSANPLVDEVGWAQALKATLDSYPNVFLTLSGHIHTVNTTRVGNRQEVLFGLSGATSTGTGAAHVRIYTFNLTSKQVNASTYSVDTQSWLTDAYNQFSFDASAITIPEGLTTGVMVLLSTVAVIVSSRYFRKRPKIENCSQVKL